MNIQFICPVCKRETMDSTDSNDVHDGRIIVLQCEYCKSMTAYAIKLETLRTDG